jgi:rhomboid protease GluP
MFAPDAYQLPPVIPHIPNEAAAQRFAQRHSRSFEHKMSMVPVVGLVLAVACAVVHVWQLATQDMTSLEGVIAQGALHRQSVMSGEVWRLVSCWFLHADIGHLLGNLLMLYILAVGCEHAIGRPRFLLVYVLAGLGGSFGSLLLTDMPSVGASGAIFGLAGFLITFFYQNRNRFSITDKRITFVLAAWAIYNIVVALAIPIIDNGAHAGGLLAGALLGLLLPPRKDLPVLHKASAASAVQAPTTPATPA